VGCEDFFADVSSKIIALADPVLRQPDIEQEMDSPPAGACIPSFTIYDVLPDLPAKFVPCTFLLLLVRQYVDTKKKYAITFECTVQQYLSCFSIR
jgi:hypothetical protein